MRFQTTAISDYENSSNPSFLKFSAGDTIIVIEVLEDGWCDGICSEKRGWFPTSCIDSSKIQNFFSSFHSSNEKDPNAQCCGPFHVEAHLQDSAWFEKHGVQAINSIPSSEEFLRKNLQNDIHNLVKGILTTAAAVSQSIKKEGTQVIVFGIETVRSMVLSFPLIILSTLDENFLSEVAQVFSSLNLLPELSRMGCTYGELCIRFTKLLKQLANKFLFFFRPNVSFPSYFLGSLIAHEIHFLPWDFNMLCSNSVQSAHTNLQPDITSFVAILSLSHEAYHCTENEFWNLEAQKLTENTTQKVLQLVAEDALEAWKLDILEDIDRCIQCCRRFLSANQRINYSSSENNPFSFTSQDVEALKDELSSNLCDLYLWSIDLEQISPSDCLLDNYSLFVDLLVSLKVSLLRIKSMIVQFSERIVFLSLEYKFLTNIHPELNDAEKSQLDGFDLNKTNWFDSKGLVCYLMKQTSPEPLLIRNLLFSFWSCNGKIEQDGKIKTATLVFIINYLLRTDIDSTFFTTIFLNTYASMISSSDLFSILGAHFRFICSLNFGKISFISHEFYRVSKRFLDILLIWFESYLVEELDNSKSIFFLFKIYKVFEVFVVPHFASAEELLHSLSHLLHHPSTKRSHKMLEGKELSQELEDLSLHNSPDPIIYKDELVLLLPPREIAKQLCILEFQSFSHISRIQFLTKIWDNLNRFSPKEKTSTFYLSNHLVNFVTETIVQEEEPRRRTNVLAYFIQVCDYLRELNNFASLFSIISALNSSPIHRLRKTWANLNSKTLASFELLNNLTEARKNFSNYRDCLENCVLPCVPFLGVYFTDLTFLKTGNKDNFQNMINFDKRTKVTRILNEIKKFQSVGYKFNPINEVQELLNEVISRERNTNNIYQRSLTVEPRESEDQALQRLLIDSGIF
ncbi:Protein ste6 [Schizosaccharomyces pombe]